MTQQEWTTRFTNRLIKAGNQTKDEAAITAAVFEGGEEVYGEPEACANNLLGLWDDEGEPA